MSTSHGDSGKPGTSTAIYIVASTTLAGLFPLFWFAYRVAFPSASDIPFWVWIPLVLGVLIFSTGFMLARSEESIPARRRWEWVTVATTAGSLLVYYFLMLCFMLIAYLLGYLASNGAL